MKKKCTKCKSSKTRLNYTGVFTDFEHNEFIVALCKPCQDKFVIFLMGFCEGDDYKLILNKYGSKLKLPTKKK